MIEWGSPVFVLALIAISTAGWVLNNWIRARHGYAVEDQWSGKTERSDVAKTALNEENARLKAQIKTFEDRLAVLERIATEERHSTAIATEIEKLR